LSERQRELLLLRLAHILWEIMTEFPFLGKLAL